MISHKMDKYITKDKVSCKETTVMVERLFRSKIDQKF